MTPKKQKNKLKLPPRNSPRREEKNEIPIGDEKSKSPRREEKRKSPRGEEKRKSPRGEEKRKSPRGEEKRKSPRGDDNKKSPSGDENNMSPRRVSKGKEIIVRNSPTVEENTKNPNLKSKKVKRSSEMKKRGGNDGLRCTLDPIINILAELKNKLINEDGSSILSPRVPFYGFLNNILLRNDIKTTNFTKSLHVISSIVNSYNENENAFKIGSTLVKFTPEDIAIIFGVSMNGDRMKLFSRDSTTSSMRGKYFEGEKAINKKVIMDQIRKLANKDPLPGLEITKLLLLLLACTCFFPNHNMTIPQSFLNHLDDLSELGEICWPKILHDDIVKKIVTYRTSPEKMNSCAIILLVWICEHTTLLGKEAGRENILPRILRWDLSKIASALELQRDVKTLSKIGDDKVIIAMSDLSDEEQLLLQLPKKSAPTIKTLERENTELKLRNAELAEEVDRLNKSNDFLRRTVTDMVTQIDIMKLTVQINDDYLQNNSAFTQMHDLHNNEDDMMLHSLSAAKRRKKHTQEELVGNNNAVVEDTAAGICKDDHSTKDQHNNKEDIQMQKKKKNTVVEDAAAAIENDDQNTQFQHNKEEDILLKSLTASKKKRKTKKEKLVSENKTVKDVAASEGEAVNEFAKTKGVKSPNSMIKNLKSRPKRKAALGPDYVLEPSKKKGRKENKDEMVVNVDETSKEEVADALSDVSKSTHWKILTKEEKCVVNKFFNGANKSTYAWFDKKSGHVIEGSVIENIMFGKQLDERVIDWYAIKLQGEQEQEATSIFFSARVWQALKGDFKTTLQKVLDERMNEITTTTEYLFFPINSTKNDSPHHWTLLVLDLTSGCWYHYNSIESLPERKNASIEDAYTLMKKVVPLYHAASKKKGITSIKINKKLEIGECPHQPDDSVDCALYVCLNMEYLSKNELIDYAKFQGRVKKLRAKITAEMLSDQDRSWKEPQN